MFFRELKEFFYFHFSFHKSANSIDLGHVLFLTTLAHSLSEISPIKCQSRKAAIDDLLLSPIYI